MNRRTQQQKRAETTKTFLPSSLHLIRKTFILTPCTMSLLNPTASENNIGNHLQTNDIYVYKGGRLDGIHEENIEHVRIDELISIIDDSAFYECGPLRTVSFSTNPMLKKIGKESFYGCHNLLSIDLKNTHIKSIGIRAFHCCNKLTTIQFPATVRQIGKECFAHCHQLKAIDLSHINHLESIEEHAFLNCTTLAMINLPPTTSCIRKGSFCYCEALETVDFRATCVKQIIGGAFFGCTNLTNIYFPTTANCIGQRSFYNCKKLAHLDLHATCVEIIEDEAFQDCSELTMVDFPKTLRSIGNKSFGNCTNLKYINLQDTSIKRIGNHAFSRCTNLTTVVGISTSRQEQLQKSIDDNGSMILPASLVYIGEGAFDGCPALKNSINNNSIHYELDLNRGGRRFLQHDHCPHVHNNDGGAKRHGKVYYSSLWPLILCRALHEIKLLMPKQRICRNDDDLAMYTKANPVQRRASVIFYLLVHGVVADLR